MTTTQLPAREYDYAVTALIRVIDGDTFDLTVTKLMRFGFYLDDLKSWSTRFRLLGIDTPEMNQVGGAAAKNFALEWIASAIDDDVLRGQSHKADSFGRWLIDLYRTDTGEHLTASLIGAGLGTVYPSR